MARHHAALSRGVPLLAMLGLLALLSLGLGLRVGSVPVDWAQLWGVLSGTAGELPQRLIVELRLPRTLSAFATGGMLALAGALLQVLLRNPLADPYVLGVSGGASAGALGAILVGAGGLVLTGSAFLGAMLSMFLVFTLAHGRGGWGPTRLLLTGVVIAAGWGALISFLLAISPNTHLRGMLFWLLGDLTDARFPGLALTLLALALLAAMTFARELNVLAHGEQKAAALGVGVHRVRWRIYVLSSLLTASAVTVAGNIGFIGLLVPHLVRLLGASDHRILLPASVLLGASLLMIADVGARSLMAPQELPVGVITAFLGVPMFLYLLNRNRGR